MWRAHGEASGRRLITGADNPPHARSQSASTSTPSTTARAPRRAAIEALCGRHNISSERLVCVFDDVNDLGMAFGCGIRVFVRRDASPLLHDYVARQASATTSRPTRPERHAVREVCELLLGLLGSFEAVVASRVAWDPEYARYFAARQAVATRLIDSHQRVGDT